jgi:hypothetical protein
MSATVPRAIARFGEAALEGRAERPRPAPSSARIARPKRRVVVRFWLPATALFWLLAPLPLLLAPLAYLAPAPFRPRNPYAAVLAVGRVLISLGGTVVDVDTPDALVRIRIF